VTGSGDWRFRDARAISLVARALVLANALVSLLTTLVLTMRPESETGLFVLAGLSIVQLLTLVAAAVAALRWLYLANANARALGATDLMGSPGWAVGWFFIPLANLVMPYVTIRDTWKASVNPRDWQAVRTPVAVGLWWGCWLIANFTSGITAAMDFERGFEAELAPEAQTLGLVSTLFWVAAALLFAWIIGRVQAAQSDPAHLGERFA